NHADFFAENRALRRRTVGRASRCAFHISALRALESIALTRCVTIRKTTIAHATLVFFLLIRSDLPLFFVAHCCLRRRLCLACFLDVVRRRLDLAGNEAVNPLGP